MDPDKLHACNYCWNILENNAILTSCQHLFCISCANTNLARSGSNLICPACRNLVSMTHGFEQLNITPMSQTDKTLFCQSLDTIFSMCQSAIKFHDLQKRCKLSHFQHKLKICTKESETAKVEITQMQQVKIELEHYKKESNRIAEVAKELERSNMYAGKVNMDLQAQISTVKSELKELKVESTNDKVILKQYEFSMNSNMKDISGVDQFQKNSQLINPRQSRQIYQANEIMNKFNLSPSFSDVGEQSQIPIMTSMQVTNNMMRNVDSLEMVDSNNIGYCTPNSQNNNVRHAVESHFFSERTATPMPNPNLQRPSTSPRYQPQGLVVGQLLPFQSSEHDSRRNSVRTTPVVSQNLHGTTRPVSPYDANQPSGRIAGNRNMTQTLHISRTTVPISVSTMNNENSQYQNSNISGYKRPTSADPNRPITPIHSKLSNRGINLGQVQSVQGRTEVITEIEREFMGRRNLSPRPKQIIRDGNR